MVTMFEGVDNQGKALIANQVANPVGGVDNHVWGGA